MNTEKQIKALAGLDGEAEAYKCYLTSYDAIITSSEQPTIKDLEV